MIPANKDKIHITQAFLSVFQRSRLTLAYLLAEGNLVIAAVDRIPMLCKIEHVTVVGVKNPQRFSLEGHLATVLKSTYDSLNPHEI